MLSSTIIPNIDEEEGIGRMRRREKKKHQISILELLKYKTVVNIFQLQFLCKF